MEVRELEHLMGPDSEVHLMYIFEAVKQEEQQHVRNLQYECEK